MFTVNEIIIYCILFVVTISSNIYYWRFIKFDEIRNPIRWSIIVNLCLIMLSILVSYITSVNVIIAIPNIMVCLASIIVVVVALKKRDQQAITIGENLLSILITVDNQINHIFSKLLNNGDNLNIQNNDEIIACLSYILDKLSVLINGKNVLKNNISLFMADPKGKYEIIISKNLSSKTVSEMNRFFYDYEERKFLGIAGLAVELGNEIYINDLENKDEKYSKFWINLPSQNKCQGTIACIPLFSREDNKTHVIGVLNIYNSMPFSFDFEKVQSFTYLFKEKIELLLLILNNENFCNKKITQ